MIINSLVLDKEKNIILAKDHHKCELCGKTKNEIYGKKVHVVTKKMGAEVVLCHDCLQELADCTKEVNE